MSCTGIVSSWILLLCLLLIFSFFSHLVFLKFCKSVAALQGRDADYLSNEGNNDVGTNDFVRKQFEKISKCEFDDILDQELVTLGWKIRRSFAQQVIATIALIVFGVWIQSVGCF